MRGRLGTPFFFGLRFAVHAPHTRLLGRFVLRENNGRQSNSVGSPWSLRSVEGMLCMLREGRIEKTNTMTTVNLCAQRKQNHEECWDARQPRRVPRRPQRLASRPPPLRWDGRLMLGPCSEARSPCDARSFVSLRCCRSLGLRPPLLRARGNHMTTHVTPGLTWANERVMVRQSRAARRKGTPFARLFAPQIPRGSRDDSPPACPLPSLSRHFGHGQANSTWEGWGRPLPSFRPMATTSSEKATLDCRVRGSTPILACRSVDTRIEPHVIAGPS